MSTPDTQIAAPLAKAASAIGAGAGTSILSTAMANPEHFFPTGAGGWAAFAASVIAALYNLHLLRELYIKRGYTRRICAWFRLKGWFL